MLKFKKFSSPQSSNTQKKANKTCQKTTLCTCQGKIRYRFLDMHGLAPDIRYKESVAFPANRVLQHVCKFALSKRNMFTAPVTQSYNSLFQKCQRFVDIHGFYLRFSHRECFSKPLWSSQVHEVQFGGDILGVGLHTRVRLDVDGEDAVRARRALV